MLALGPEFIDIGLNNIKGTDIEITLGLPSEHHSSLKTDLRFEGFLREMQQHQNPPR